VPPRLSILLPVRNAAATLPEALASLAAQTEGDFELLLVNDGSVDNSAEIARLSWGDDGRLRLLEPGRVGLIAALQIGLAECRAELVARMDADDVADPRRLALQADLLAAEPGVAVVGSLVACFGPAMAEGTRLYEAWLNGLRTHEEMMRERFVESPLAHPTVTFRKTAVEAVGGYRDNGWPEDYDLWLRLATAGYCLAKVPEVLLEWRDTAGRHSRNHPRYARDAFLACKAHHLANGPLTGRDTLALWGAGRVGRRLARFLSGEGKRVDTWVDIDPRKTGRDLHGAPVVSPQQLGAPAGRLLVVSVGSRGARELIRVQLREQGWSEGVDFFCAA
jgi:glycosyltransferase involved in cell wall biosynthesis